MGSIQEVTLLSQCKSHSFFLDNWYYSDILEWLPKVSEQYYERPCYVIYHILIILMTAAATENYLPQWYFAIVMEAIYCMMHQTVHV